MTRTLVGQYFHGTEPKRWHGRIVGEPSPGTYLVEVFHPLGSTTWVVPIADMAYWVIYDTERQMEEDRENITAEWNREYRRKRLANQELRYPI